jgi:hypothetical protein
MFGYYELHIKVGRLKSIYLWLYSPCGPWPLFQFLNPEMVGLLGRRISPPQCRYLHTRQHKHRINAHRDIHVSSGIRTHDHSVRASEDSSFLSPQRGHCDRRQVEIRCSYCSNRPAARTKRILNAKPEGKGKKEDLN